MIRKSFYLITAMAVILFVVWQLRNNKKSAEERIYRKESEKPVAITADTLKMETAGNFLSFAGTFQPYRETQISSEIQGKVESMLVKTGETVKLGQPLMQLDNALLQWQLQNAEVQTEGLEADVRRYAVLAQADAIEGIQLEKTERALKSALIQKSMLEEQIKKSLITAPFDGTVTARMTETGAFASPGIPLITLTDISRLRFIVNIPEQELHRFTTGQLVRVIPDVHSDLSLEGKVTMIGSKANPANSFPVECEVRNTPDRKIRAGMFGKAFLQEGLNKTRLVIASSSLSVEGTDTWVHLVRNGKAERVKITVETRFADRVVVRDGLKEGDILITSGFISLREGIPVTIK